MRPLRLELTMALARQVGVLDTPGVEVRAPVPATDDVLELVHDPLYVASVRRAPDDVLGRLSLRWGLGTGDNPVFPRMHEASALITGASVDAARAVWEGTHQHAVNISGGLHHAMRDRASGFCIYDDPAVAIAWLLAAGAQRIAYVDVDVHHGDGVQAAFYDDPRVLTVVHARERSHAVPGHRLGRRDRGRRRRRYVGQRRAAGGDRRRRLAAGVPRRRPGAARLPARRCSSPSTAATPTRWTRWPTC